jgi:hypothetical protein
VLGFHAASYFDDAQHTLVPNREGTQVLLRLYPPEIRDWIDRHGGLKPEWMALRGNELAALYNACPEEELGNYSMIRKSGKRFSGKIMLH